MKLNPTVLGFFRKELVQTLRDRRMRIMLFVMPVIQMTIFGVAISTETRDIKLAAVYEPNDFLSWTPGGGRGAYSSQWFVPAKTGDEKDAFRMVQSGKADAVLIAPEKGLTRAVGMGGADLQLLIDSSNITKAEAIRKLHPSDSFPGDGRGLPGKEPKPAGKVRGPLPL